MKVPAARTESEAVACIYPAVRAYTALIYHANISPGACVLIMSGASAFGHIAIQLALSWGVKVYKISRTFIIFQFVNNAAD